MESQTEPRIELDPELFHEMEQLRAEGMIPEFGHGHMSEAGIVRMYETMKLHERTAEQCEFRKQRALKRAETCKRFIETWARWEREQTGEAEFTLGDFTIKTRKPSKNGKLVYDTAKLRSYAESFDYGANPELFDVRPNISRVAKYVEENEPDTPATRSLVRREYPTECSVSIKEVGE